MVIGKNHCNVKEIIKVTGAQILFSDAQDPNIPNLKKSNVTITGNIHQVYAARQILIVSIKKSIKRKKINLFVPGISPFITDVRPPRIHRDSTSKTRTNRRDSKQVRSGNKYTFEIETKQHGLHYKRNRKICM